ncbi:MAG: peptidase U32 family protein [Clostridium sp.]
METKTAPMEILAPAGDWERLEAALDYGAHAVYLAGKEFGMRSSPDNFDREALEKAVALAHSKGVRVYLTCNTLPRNRRSNGCPVFWKKAPERGWTRLFLQI